MNPMKKLLASLFTTSTSTPKPPKRAINRRSFLGTSLAIGGLVFVMVAMAQSAPTRPGPELGQVQWRDRRYSHWFSEYHRAKRHSRWSDLGDPGPCRRREAGREYPSRRPGPPSGRRRFCRRQRQRQRFCDVVLLK